MKKQLKELQDLIIERIKNNQYDVVGFELNDSDFDIQIAIDCILFRYSVPFHKDYFVEHSNPVKIKLGVSDHKEIASLLFERHYEPIKNKEVKRKIEQLQKQLK